MKLKLVGAQQTRIPRLPSGHTEVYRNQTVTVTEEEYENLGAQAAVFEIVYDPNDLLRVSGAELAYAERTTNFGGITVFTAGTAVEVPEMAITFDADGETPIVVEAQLWTASHTTAPKLHVYEIREGATVIRSGFVSITTANGFSPPLSLRRRLVPTEGEHTYRFWAYLFNTGGTGTMYAGVNDPCWMRATKVSVP